MSEIQIQILNLNSSNLNFRKKTVSFSLQSGFKSRVLLRKILHRYLIFKENLDFFVSKSTSQWLKSADEDWKAVQQHFYAQYARKVQH